MLHMVKKQLTYSLAIAVMFSALTEAFPMTINSATKQNEVINDDNSSSEITPSMPSLDEGPDNSFSRMVNHLLTCESISLPSFTLTITPTASDPLNLIFSDFILDMTNANTMDLNFTSALEVKYCQIDEKLNLTFDSTGRAYVRYNDLAYSLKITDTVSGIFKVLDSLSIAVPDVSSSLAGFDTSTFINKIQTSFDATFANSKTNSNGGYDYEITLDPITIGSITASDIDIVLVTDSNDNLSSLKANTPLSFSSGVTIAFDGSLKVNDTSSYVAPDISDYQNLDNASDSILATLMKVADKKQADFSLSATLTDPNKNVSSLTGLVQGDCSKVEKDLTKGIYNLSLTHDNDSNTLLDQINAYYGNDTIYLALNDQFKGRVSNSSLSEVFDYISQASDEKGYDQFASLMTTVLGTCDFTSLLKGDYSGYKNFIKSFKYDEAQGFTMVINAAAFNLGDYEITLALDLDSTGIKDITLNNLQYQNYSLNTTIKVSDFTSITVPDSTSYKDYSGTAPLIKTVSDLVKSKQVSASYSLTYTDDYQYVASGEIDADLSSVTSFDDLTTSLKGGDYHLSLNTVNETCTSYVNAYYQDTTLYVGYGNNTYEDIFKNSLADSGFGAINDALTSHAESSGTALKTMDDVINEIKNSTNLKTDLETMKKGYLISALKSIISVDKDNTDASKIVVVLNVPYVLEGTTYLSKVSAITLTLNSNDLSYKKIEVSCSIDSKPFTFDLTLKDYSDAYKLTDTAKALYTPINKAGELLQSFYNLPNFQTDKYGIGVSASLTSGDKTYGITGSAAVDATSLNGTDLITTNADDTKKVNLPSMYGSLTLNMPSLNSGSANADHKVDFTYDYSAGQLYADYNDKMHLKMKRNTVDEVYSNLSSVTSDQNLLFRYLKNLNSTSTGMPITDCIKNGNPSILLTYPYIKKVEITDSSITLMVDAKLLDSSDTTGNIDTITLYYDATNKAITKATVAATITSTSTESDGVTIDTSTTTINATISLLSYAEVSVPEVATSDVTFVDLDGFSTLSDCLIDTTENNYFEISGSLSVKLKIIGLTLNTLTTNATAKIYIKDEHAYAYLHFQNGSTAFNNSGYYATEFFISEKQVWVSRTTSTTEHYGFLNLKTRILNSAEVFKTTRENLEKNIAYYLLSFILDLDDMKTLSISSGKIALGQIFKAMASSDSSSTTITDDFSDVINSATLDTTNRLFALDLNLNNLISISSVSFTDNTKVNVSYAEDKNGYAPFSAIDISTSLSAYSVVDVEASGSFSMSSKVLNGPVDLTMDEAKGTDYMYRYFNFIDNFTSAYGSYEDTSSLPFYAISSIDGGSTSYTLNDNASSAKKTASTNSSSGLSWMYCVE